MNQSEVIYATVDKKDECLKKVDYQNVAKSLLIIRALNHSVRQRILKLIEEQSKLTVTQIYVQLRMQQSVASQHLAILRRAGVVETLRNGKNIYYQLNNRRLKEIDHFIKNLSNG